MDFDWKRKPTKHTTRPVLEVPFLAFHTEPWTTVEEFLDCREQWEHFQTQTKHCLKTEEDLTAFLNYLNAAPINQFKSIEDLFEIIKDQSNYSHIVMIGYDQALRFPSFVEIDPSSATDDDTRYEVSDVELLE